MKAYALLTEMVIRILLTHTMVGGLISCKPARVRVRLGLTLMLGWGLGFRLGLGLGLLASF